MGIPQIIHSWLSILGYASPFVETSKWERVDFSNMMGGIDLPHFSDQSTTSQEVPTWLDIKLSRGTFAQQEHIDPSRVAMFVETHLANPNSWQSLIEFWGGQMFKICRTLNSHSSQQL